MTAYTIETISRVACGNKEPVEVTVSDDGKTIALSQDDQTVFLTSATLEGVCAAAAAVDAAKPRPLDDGLDWSGVTTEQDEVDAAARALAGRGDLTSVFYWGSSPQGIHWWIKRNAYWERHGKHKKGTKPVLRSYLAYAASKGVTPTVEAAA